MKYPKLTEWYSTGTMNDIFRQVATIRISRKKLVTGSILFLVQTALVFSWSFFNAPLAISPAGGVALALLYLVGTTFWPAILVGSFLGLILNHATLLVTFVCTSSYVLQALVGTYFLKNLEFNQLLSRLRDGLVLVVVLGVSALIFPTISIGAVFLFGAGTPGMGPSFFSGLSWSNVWIGTLFSSLVVTPFILRWALRPHERTFRETVETVIILGILVLISTILFWSDTQSIWGVSLAYLLFVPLFWAALRLGPRITLTALTLSASIAISKFFYDSAAPGSGFALNQDFFQTQIFFSMITMMFIIIVSIEEERKEKTKELESYVTGLRTEIRELSDDDKLKNEFIATLAHELRNPLAPVVSTLELLRMREELSREALQLVDRVEHQTETIRKLLDDLLDVSRITQKKFKLSKERRMLKELLSHCAHSAEHIMKSHGHTLSITVPEEDIQLFVDPTRFEQIVTNLLFNAAKYTEAGGHIALTCSTENDQLCLRLKDDGIGIEPENLEQIFLPFRQMKTKHHAGTGLGIGLAITKQLVEMHGGTIIAKSEGLGKGSEFLVYLPITDNSEESKNHVALESGDTNIHQHRILVVDDNIEAALALSRLLEYRGHQIYVGHTGEEALENARLFKPDVILLDIGLPDIDGYEVARQLRRNGVRAKLIALTGYGQEEDKQRAEEADFNHHLVKPASLVDIEKLL